MHIEHTALNVQDPVHFADWYVRHLGMEIVMNLDKPPHTHFLRGAPGQAMLEVYHNTDAPVPDYTAMDPLILHIAFASEHVKEDRERLVAAGATPAGDVDHLPNGDTVAMLRDPWGMAIQLVHRTSFSLRG